MRTLMIYDLENEDSGPFIAGEKMVSYRSGKEIKKGQKAYLLDGYVCLSERDAYILHNQLFTDAILD